MKIQIIIFASILLGACGSHKGAIKPNPSLADFNKYGEAYYLSIDQLKIGDPKDVVIKEYDDKYESETNDQSREIWIFKSYQATFAIDPVQKLVTVEFMNDSISDVSEKYLRGQKPNVPKQVSADERLCRLKRLHKDGII